MDTTLFLGRFHPLLVHLPITLILLGGAMYFLAAKGKYKMLDSSVSFVFVLGAISAVISAILGWFIAEDAGYSPDTLLLHRWVGIIVCVASILICLVRFQLFAINKNILSALVIASMALVAFTGHLGGTLTHGEDYLTEYAPEFVKGIFPNKVKSQYLRDLHVHPDSIIVFEDIILPLFEAKCGNCHNDSQQKGGLNLLTRSGVEKGGDDGNIYSKGKPYVSELILRTTLPQGHKKFMPTKGDPLSYSEIELLKWWINSEALYDLRFSALDPNTPLAALLKRDFGLDPKSRPIYEMVKVEPVSEEIIGQLRQKGLEVRPIFQNSNYLEIGISPGVSELTFEDFKTILQVSEQVTWLDLGEAGITDEYLEVIGQLSNLTRLLINSNDISDGGLIYLNNLKFLESLNLYDTGVSDEGLSALEPIKSLRTAYMWKTQVTREGANGLMEKLPNLTVDLGMTN